jgi:hypothetical protein
VFASVAGIGIGNNLLRAAGSGKMYLNPASGNYDIGATVSVAVRVDVGSEKVNAAEARLSYNASQLEYMSISGSGSAYGIEANASGGNGQVVISRGNISDVSGDQLLATVSFKALTAGSAAVTVNTESIALRSADQADVIGTRNGGTFTINASSQPQPQQPAPQQPAPPATKPSTTTTAPKSTGTTVSVTPRGSTSPASIPSDSTIQVTTPTTVQPADDTSDINKVEYYLKGKLIATVTQPPFSYEVDTTELRNGTYELTTKTYKADGSIVNARHTLNVANPMNLAQIALQAKHYWWLLAIIAILMVDVVTTLYLRHKNGRSGGSLLDLLMPWRNRQDELSFSGYTTGAAYSQGNNSNDRAQGSAQSGSDSKLEHFTPNLPQAGQVVAPRDDKSDDNDPYHLLPR